MSTFSASRRSGTPLALLAVSVIAIATQSPALAETVRTVNGEDIDSAMVDMYLESRTQRPAAEATPAQRDMVLQELTDIYLLATQPRADELSEDPAIKAQIELQQKSVIAQALIAEFFAQNQATEEEILAEYQNQTKLAAPLQFKARHILVETQAAAQDLITQLNDGADFQELAKTHSTGPSGPSGGDLGWFAPEQMVKPFSDAVAAMEDGTFTQEPVQTQFGWHVILREESRENVPPTLESVRDVVKQRVEQTKFQAHLEELRAAYAEQ